MDSILEICCGSFEDAKTAFDAGAEQVELNSALFLGGLTPSLAAMKKTRELGNLKVIAMVRPRGAGFCYSEIEYEVMCEECRTLLEHGADGIAFGFLNADRTIDLARTKTLIDLIHQYGKEAVFHRAFDCLADMDQGAKDLIALKADRILTSGGAEKAWDGRECLKLLQAAYGRQIEFLPGSGISAQNARQMMEYTNINRIHSSCKSWREDVTTKGNQVSYAYAGEQLACNYEAVSSELVKGLCDVIYK